MSIPLHDHYLDLLEQASKLVVEKDVETYMRLRTLIREKPNGYESEFRDLFSRYYRFNSAGLTEEFKNRYFDHLFALDPMTDNKPYAEILLDLHQLPDRRGRNTLQCSFVSKMVAILDESYPIYDKYIRGFFGIGVPELSDVRFRIAGFVANLMLIRKTYGAWDKEPAFQNVIERLKEAHPALETCSVQRQADFLIWTIGKNNLYASTGATI